MFPELETERLRLRQFREADVEPLLAFYQDPLSQKIFGPDASYGEVWRGVAKFIGHWTLRGFGQWAVEEKSSGRFAGYAGLWFPGDFADVEVGYGLHPAFRGKGYALEAARAARDHGYRTLGLPRLVSYIAPDNQPSLRIAERLEATPDGSFLLHGKPHTIYLHKKL
ncbi:MAG: GNAT family N-acetyltransferase [Proteobacteria bacterium]|nr:GNAT family N-acetyltransferase [Pseudomonadota bacterium]